MLENSLFGILALFLLGGSLGMIFFTQTLFSAISFMFAMLALAGMFALLENSFLFLAQIMVSVGAVVVLSMLVIVSVNLKASNLPHESAKGRWIIFSALLVTPLAMLIYKALAHTHTLFEKTDEGYGSLKMMGATLFSDWVLPFEIVSVLLLAAMVGAIMIGRKEKRHDT
ncbi:MAG: NADH-quinone oxidoreductase subunit J [Epsilonproteobacteria bacterium]|nr:MAG: NADH-quinone oxidoreductase subunit J [Campylobacterota bacterium]